VEIYVFGHILQDTVPFPYGELVSIVGKVVNFGITNVYLFKHAKKKENSVFYPASKSPSDVEAGYCDRCYPWRGPSVCPSVQT
jgi:hypothetical protein